MLTPSLRRHPLWLILALSALALGLPYLAGLLVPTSVTTLLWLDYATLGVGVLVAVLLLLRWRVTAAQPRTQHNTAATHGKAIAQPPRYRAHAHRWLGRVLAVPLSWLLLTGSLTLYRAELDLWLTPALRQCCVTAPEQTAPAISQQLLLAQRYLSTHAAASRDWYMEFASARKPYLTLHWSDASTPGALQRQYLGLNGQPLGPVIVQPFGVQSHTFGGLVFDLHYTLLGRAWLEPLKRAVQPWFKLPVTGLGLTASLALLWLVLAISGVWLSWRWWRQGRAGGTQLRWHVYLGLVGAPWLVLYGVSALATQLGNWRDIPATIGAAAYYSELFAEPKLPALKDPVSDQPDHSQQDHPQPELPRQVAANDSPAATRGSAELFASETTPSDELSAAHVQQLVQRWPSAEPMAAISKLSWPRAGETAIWQLSGSALWPAQGAVMPVQARQRLQDGAIALASTTAPTPWQWRHALYQLHQSYYLNPWQRAVMFALGLLCWLGVVLALRRNQPNAATRYPVNGWLHAAATLPLVVLLSTAGLLQVLELPALTLFAISSGVGVLWMSRRKLYLYRCKNNQ